MKNIIKTICIFITLSACAKDDDRTQKPDTEIQENDSAMVRDVSVSGEENKYTFSVTIKSDDLSCVQYADWWEVITPEGTLIYRRILAHSHVDEQPFTRSGGIVDIKKDQIVFIRAHLSTAGYEKVVFKGSVATGFEKSTFETDFDKQLEQTKPLPSGCAY